jgi:hypothetical protein
MSLRGQIERLIDQWPQLSDDLALLPEALHRIVHDIVERPVSPPREPVPQPRRNRDGWIAVPLTAIGAVTVMLAPNAILSGIGWAVIGAAATAAATALRSGRD